MYEPQYSRASVELLAIFLSTSTPYVEIDGFTFLLLIVLLLFLLLAYVDRLFVFRKSIIIGDTIARDH